MKVLELKNEKETERKVLDLIEKGVKFCAIERTKILLL